MRCCYGCEVFIGLGGVDRADGVARAGRCCYGWEVLLGLGDVARAGRCC